MDGDENYHEWELARTAAELGITPQQLKDRREGKGLQLAHIATKAKSTTVGKTPRKMKRKYHLARGRDGKTLCGREVAFYCNHVEEDELDQVEEPICDTCKKKV